MQVSCIKCKTKYDESSDEVYLCPSCLTVKNKIAAEIDKKFAGRIIEKPLNFYERNADVLALSDRILGRIKR